MMHAKTTSQRRRSAKDTADNWEKTIVAFQSPHRLKDLCIDQDNPIEAEASERSKTQEFKIRLATNKDRQHAANVLIHKMYSWRGYEAQRPDQGPYKITLLAYQQDIVVGTLTLGLDSPAGLTVDRLYKIEADQLRSEGRSLCDITKLAVDQHLNSRSVLAALFHLAVIYARNIHKATDCLIEINPRHASFYKKMIGFVPYGAEKLCERVNAPALLLRLDLSYSDAQIRRYGGMGDAAGVKTLYPYAFSKEDEIGITDRLIRET